MSDPGTDSDEDLDPRVQEELEKLNQFTDEINQLELQLEDANGLFRTLLTDSTHHLKAMSKKLGPCIEKARPYYNALKYYQLAQKECQSAATHYQRASGIHLAAKETIALAEERFLTNSNSWEFDNAWQEMLNHATIKVMEAEKQKTESEAEHLKKAAAFQKAEAEVQKLEKKLGKLVAKSAPYFEQKDVFNKTLAAQRDLVEELQKKVVKRKSMYAQSLRNLEDISESIHKRRKLKSTPRKKEVKKSDNMALTSLPSFDLDRCDGAYAKESLADSSSSGRDNHESSEDKFSLDDGSSSSGFHTDYSSASAQHEKDSVDGASSIGYLSQLSIDSVNNVNNNFSYASSSSTSHYSSTTAPHSSTAIATSHDIFPDFLECDNSQDDVEKNRLSLEEKEGFLVNSENSYIDEEKESLSGILLKKLKFPWKSFDRDDEQQESQEVGSLAQNKKECEGTSSFDTSEQNNTTNNTEDFTVKSLIASGESETIEL